MAKTKEPKTTAEAIYELQAAQFRDNEKVLRRVVTEQDGELSPSDVMHFACQPLYDVSMSIASVDGRISLRREIGRVAEALRLEKLVGLPGDREKHEDQRASHKAAMESEIPNLEQQLRILQNQIDAMQAKDRENDKRSEQIAKGLRDLESLAPPMVRKEVDATLQKLQSSELAKEIRAKRSRRDMIQNVLKLSSESEQALLHASAQKHNGRPELIQRTEQGTCVNHAKWSAYIAELRQELAAIDAKLPELEKTYSTEEADVKAMLRVYGYGD